MLEVRTYSYFNKTSILHIDRRQQFKQKLLQKETSKKERSNSDYTFDGRF